MRPVAFAAALVLALAVAATAEEPCATYGQGVSLETATAPAVILAEPATYAGKEVRVDGTVREVCQKMGCWMEVAAGEDTAVLRVKVKDGEIVFPVSARGQQAKAQGVVEVKEMTREAWVDWQKHLAEENGGTFDASAVGEGPFQHVQVRGTGAVVCK